MMGDIGRGRLVASLLGPRLIAGVVLIVLAAMHKQAPYGFYVTGAACVLSILHYFTDAGEYRHKQDALFFDGIFGLLASVAFMFGASLKFMFVPIVLIVATAAGILVLQVWTEFLTWWVIVIGLFAAAVTIMHDYPGWPPQMVLAAFGISGVHAITAGVRILNM